MFLAPVADRAIGSAPRRLAAKLGAALATRRAVILFFAVLLAIGCVFVSRHLIGALRLAVSEADWPRLASICIVFALFYWMFIWNFIYLLADYGHEKRQRTHRSPSGSKVGTLRQRETEAPLLFLIPSYKEEEWVIRQSLMSAALVEYPGRRVVLLIDDPPIPATAEDARGLLRSRRLPVELQAEFDAAARPFQHALRAAQERERHGKIELSAESGRLAQLYDMAAAWLETQSAEFTRGDSINHSHMDRLFLEKILREPARLHRLRAKQIIHELLGVDEIRSEYHRLADLFRVEFSSFERKRYVNLSHAPNKAMNLNSYIALIGKCFREVERPDGLHLEACAAGHGTVEVPAAPFIATVDADSLITADFALRLIQIMDARGNDRIAVAQTPYTAVPDAPSRLERAAAASTDVQFFNHQGMAYFDASWWVGASALMRHEALEDIAVEIEERGHKVKVYIQDKILIEDAAATIDLVSKGWRIHHWVGRLSYSATPPDFGALVIQRRRWSNGGLLIVPALLRYVLRRPWSSCKFREVLLRVPNLLSASMNGIGLPILLFCRFDDAVVPLWMPLVALPYYLLYASDLKLAGYRRSDLLRVYVLNTVLLVPVYLAGTLQSLRQALTGKQRPFKRTPKTEDRTPVQISYLFAEYGLLLYCLFCAANDGIEARYNHMLFSSLNAIALLYGISRFIGLRNSAQDAIASLRAWSRRLVPEDLLAKLSRKPAFGVLHRLRGASGSIAEKVMLPVSIAIPERLLSPARSGAGAALGEPLGDESSWQHDATMQYENASGQN